MYKNIIRTTFFIFTLSLFFQGTAHSVPTKWERVETSLTDLLNGGWQIIGTSSNRAAYRVYGSSEYDEKTHTFTLAKSGKYIICVTVNPVDPVAQAGCRKLN